jgi:hypothetical protein
MTRKFRDSRYVTTLQQTAAPISPQDNASDIKVVERRGIGDETRKHWKTNTFSRAAVTVGIA